MKTIISFAILSVALAPWAVSAVERSDAAFAKACPADAAWAARQPSNDHQSDTHVSNPSLRAEIDRRFDADQKARNALIEKQPTDLIAKLRAVDSANLQWLRDQIDSHGFPPIVQVGRRGIYEFFILAQHADADPTLQSKVLGLMKGAAASDGISPKEIAFLTDRVLVAQHQPQRYGTQMGPGPDGKRTLRPVEDVANLDKRRASMGLEPEADYQCRTNFFFGTK